MQPRRFVPHLLAGCLAISACAPTTPLFIAQVTTGEVVEYKALKAKRMTAAIEEEGDLLTYSAQAIRDVKSLQAEQLYLSGYRDHNLSDEIRAFALYQIALIYMSRFNDQRDDTKARDYLLQINREFPSSQAARRGRSHLSIIEQRAAHEVQKNARERLEHWQPQLDLDLNKPSLDTDMTLLSRRAVLKDRAPEAEALYQLALKDPGVPLEIKHKALYQMALMYQAPDNPRADRDKSIAYLRQLLQQQPDPKLRHKAAVHLDRALNLSPP
ncbi:outer membrane assembly lipoprotein YfiO [Pseudomonas sp. EL_65y_Pfl2_R95]|uniref:outer membrane assembly lipoprotein YfiO n=1 Tax=Pseudomonas sp. EL_65y_Pfl2_R95 TaxID=3088698 RepID=UPI0030DABB5D